jgi:hypothetical protein
MMDEKKNISNVTGSRYLCNREGFIGAIAKQSPT